MLKCNLFAYSRHKHQTITMKVYCMMEEFHGTMRT